MAVCLGTTFQAGGGIEMQVSASLNRRLAIVAAAYLVAPLVRREWR